MILYDVRPCPLFCYRIDHWDCEKEKVVVVCEKSVMIVKYDFIASKIYDAKRMLLHNIQKIQMGDFEYPSYSMM